MSDIKSYFEKYKFAMQEGYIDPSSINTDKYFKDKLAKTSRDYQEEAFRFFIHHFENSKTKTFPMQLLFNMATGSGKTHIMGGLMLYLCSKGYKHFLFITRLRGVLAKTQKNFTIGDETCVFKGNPIQINFTNSFSTDPDGIELCIASASAIHGDLWTEKENCNIDIQTLKDKKIVIIADEAHNFQASTKKEKDEENTLEATINKILHFNQQNIMLEFSATIPQKLLNEKYKQNLLYKYNFLTFYNAGYSKTINVVNISFGLHQQEELFWRTIYACINSNYRKALAGDIGINLKPIILARLDTKKSCEETYKYFCENLANVQNLDVLYNNKSFTGDNLPSCLKYFENNKIELLASLKADFAPQNTHIATNNEKNDDKIIDINKNSIRIVYDVARLTEGWDVLNLFDIVKLYTTKATNPTTQDAQLIGRGARYYPFAIQNHSNKYTRKSENEQDSVLKQKLKELETLYFFCESEGAYLSQLQQSIKNELEIDEKYKHTMTVKKDKFVGDVLNYKIKTNRRELVEKAKTIKEISIDISTANHQYNENDNFINKDITNTNQLQPYRSIQIKDIPINKIYDAMDDASFNDYFSFENLQSLFANINSRKDFINLLANISIQYSGNFTQQTLIKACEQIKNNLICDKYIGTDEFNNNINIAEIVKEKTLYSSNDKETTSTTDCDFFLQDNLILNNLEQNFINFVCGLKDKITKKYKRFYVLRNERDLKIYNFDNGKGFEPDFIILAKKHNSDEELTIQVFIESKGEHLVGHDQWKSELLININSGIICGLPFFYNDNNTKFTKAFKDKLELN